MIIIKVIFINSGSLLLIFNKGSRFKKYRLMSFGGSFQNSFLMLNLFGAIYTNKPRPDRKIIMRLKCMSNIFIYFNNYYSSPT